MDYTIDNTIDIITPENTVFDLSNNLSTILLSSQLSNQPPSEQPSKQPAIDKITMELMMNRSHYKKYLLKQDPNKYQEKQEYIQKIKRYKLKILSIMNELLDDSVKLDISEKYTRDINDSFNEYLKTCVKHFEICELENHSADTDTLFPLDQSSDQVLGSQTNVVKTHFTMDRFVNKQTR
jgi:hypothetical protein